MTKHTQPAQPAGHSDYGYPTQEQAFHSATHVGMMLLGREARDNSALVHHLYTVAGYGLSIAAPVPVNAGPADELADVEEEAKQAFGPLATAQAQPAGLNWIQLVQLAWQLLQLLRQRG